MTDQFDYTNYAKKMRLALSDKQITLNDGKLNHQYFLVKKGQYWNEEMQNELIKGIANEGVGEVQLRGALKNLSQIEIELRTCLLFGISDISKYQGEKMSYEQISEERESNINKAKQLNKLKNGIYMI